MRHASHHMYSGLSGVTVMSSALHDSRPIWDRPAVSLRIDHGKL